LRLYFDACGMTYQETLDFLYAQLPMFQRIGAAAYKKDLTNTVALCAHLGNPHTRFPTIHVAGTNGKGSVSHMLAAVCQAAGLKTGLYVSPHYKDFRERIKINGDYIPHKTVTAFVETNRAKIEEIQPSFFELCVALAFEHFANERVDIAIIEVGLGGRLDSTNVITPLASVITNISYDHMDMLGDTLAKIAFEKAGIIKPGVPVVIGETHPESAPVFREKALETGSSIVFADQQFDVEVVEENLFSGQTLYRVLKGNQLWADQLLLDAAGPFQGKNVATVLQTVDLLKIGTPDFAVKPRGAARQLSMLDPEPEPEPTQGPIPTAVLRGLSELRALTRFQGRWQWISREPAVLCDSAHNEAGLKDAFNQVARMPFKGLHIVTGFVNDKDLKKALHLFPQHASYYFAKADIPRGLDAELLREQAEGFGLRGNAYGSVAEALDAAKNAARDGDLVLVIGSIFVVAEVL
jgi:dihydrofolate synthase/folylpolyglutamate synthase